LITGPKHHPLYNKRFSASWLTELSSVASAQTDYAASEGSRNRTITMSSATQAKRSSWGRRKWGSGEVRFQKCRTPTRSSKPAWAPV